VSYRLLRPLLFGLEPERSHRLTMNLLAAGHALRVDRLVVPRLPVIPVEVMGLSFPNAVGLAAGLDKNGEHVDALSALGFGFIEVGTVTPRAQPGNPHPRMFRLPQVQAVINRMGFNNLGVDRLVNNLRRARYRGVLGINIGKNADTPMERATSDYVTCLRKVYPLASYVTVNVSSPNTPNLRRLQSRDTLDRLLATLKGEQQALSRATGRYVPLTLKLAPDLDEQQLTDIARLLLHHGIDGVIATNTTIARTGVAGLPNSEEVGGLSGGPLREPSTAMVRRLHSALVGRIPIIGVGGILADRDAMEKTAAGARLIQLYTGLIYSGPRLVADCVRALNKR